MPHFPAITHVAVTVTDLRTSSEWYRRLLDVDPVLDEDGGDFHHVVFPLNGGMLLGLHAHGATDPGDVDLEQLAAALSDHGPGGREQRGAESSSAQLRRDVELVEQGDRAVVPDVRAQGQERDGDGGVAGQQGDHVSAGQEPPEPRREDGCPGCRGVVLTIERIQQPGHGGGLRRCGHSGCIHRRLFHPGGPSAAGGIGGILVGWLGSPPRVPFFWTPPSAPPQPN